MTQPPYFSLVIPAYNEESNLRRGTLTSVLDYLSAQKYSWEIVLVNDGSSDHTLNLLHELAKKSPRIRVIDNPHQGKAATVMTGALSAKGQYILFTDMDQATPITETEKVLAAFSQGSDIVIGSRANRKGAPLYRQILAYGMVVLRTLILRLPFRDTQCGFKAFTHPVANTIFTKLRLLHPPHPITGSAVNAGFDLEILFLGRKLGYKISQVPVAWTYQKSVRVSFIKDALTSTRDLLLIRWRSLRHTYDPD